jgi:hypothetical protein
VQALNSHGVETYDSYLTDGHSEYFGIDGFTVKSPAAHEKLSIAETSRREEFLEHLNLHNQHATTHLEMSKGFAESGIEKWTVEEGNENADRGDRKEIGERVLSPRAVIIGCLVRSRRGGPASHRLVDSLANLRSPCLSSRSSAEPLTRSTIVS